jgi:hypothetical protein
MLSNGKLALAVVVSAGMIFGALDAASAKSKPHHARHLRSAPVYMIPDQGIISGYRNTPQNWVPPPAHAGGVG